MADDDQIKNINDTTSVVAEPSTSGAAPIDDRPSVRTMGTDTPAILDNLPAEPPLNAPDSNVKRFHDAIAGLSFEQGDAAVLLMHRRLLTGTVMASDEYWETLGATVVALKEEPDLAEPGLFESVEVVLGGRSLRGFFGELLAELQLRAEPGALTRETAFSAIMEPALYVATEVSPDLPGDVFDREAFLGLCGEAWDLWGAIKEITVATENGSGTPDDPTRTLRDCRAGNTCRIVDGRCVNCNDPA